MYVSPFADRSFSVLNGMHGTTVDAGEALSALFSPGWLVCHGNRMYRANSLAQFTERAGIGGVKLSCADRETIKKRIYQHRFDRRTLSRI